VTAVGTWDDCATGWLARLKAVIVMKYIHLLENTMLTKMFVSLDILLAEMRARK